MSLDKDLLEEILVYVLNNDLLTHIFKDLIWGIIRYKEENWEDSSERLRGFIEHSHKAIYEELINLTSKTIPLKDYEKSAKNLYNMLRRYIFRDLSINETTLLDKTRQIYKDLALHFHEIIPDDSKSEFLLIIAACIKLMFLVKEVIFFLEKNQKKKLKSININENHGIFFTLKNDEILETFIHMVFSSRKVRDLIFRKSILDISDISNSRFLQSYLPYYNFNHWKIENLLSEKTPNPFRPVGPHLIDFKKGNWVFFPKIAKLVVKNLEKHRKSILISATSGTGKTVISRLIGYTFHIKGFNVFYIDCLKRNAKNIETVIDQIIIHHESGAKKLLNVLFIFENVHSLDNELRLKLNKCKDTTLCLLTERIFEEKREKKESVEVFRQNFDLFQRIEISLNHWTFRNTIKGIITLNTKSRQILNQIEYIGNQNLWIYAIILKLLKNSLEMKQDSSIIDIFTDQHLIGEKITEYFEDLLKIKAFKLNSSEFDLYLNHIHYFMGILSLFSEYELWTERRFIDHLLSIKDGTPIGVLNSEININKKILTEIQSFLIDIFEISNRTVDLKPEFEEIKLEKIIFLINKLIFIQYLDKLWAIPIGFLYKEWVRSASRWETSDKTTGLTEFFDEGLNKFFWEYYDTDLFKEREENKTFLDYIKQDQNNTNKFYENLQKIIGINFYLQQRGMIFGLLQYNFRRINEDILGKAYESYLAEVRGEQGIYYTPSYITSYISKDVVHNKFKYLISEFKTNLESENFAVCENIFKEISSIRVVDPACGSGSFLIKILKLFWNTYEEIFNLLKNAYENSRKRGTLEITPLTSKIQTLLNQVELDSPNRIRSIIKDILLNNIYGVDLDKKALQVTKLNLWLNAIKLSPTAFQYWKLKTNKHILPSLELNLREGNSLISPPLQNISSFLHDNHNHDIKMLFKLQDEYRKDITKSHLIQEIEHKIKQLCDNLNIEFISYLEEKGFDQAILTDTKPFYWCLDFWTVFFNPNGELLDEDDQGFDVVIGNPPYVGWNDIRFYRNFFENKIYDDWEYDCRPRHADAQPNLYIFFIIRAISLLKNEGILSYILPREWLFHDKILKIRNQIIDCTKDLYVFKFHPNFLIFKSTEPDGTTSTVGTTSLILKSKKGSNDNFYDIDLNETNEKVVKKFLEEYQLNEIYGSTISDYSLDAKLLAKSEFRDKRWETYSKLMKNLIDACEEAEYLPLSNGEEFYVFGGFQPNVDFSYKFLINDDQIENLNDNEKQICYRCIYDAADIERYYLKESSSWWIVSNDLYETEDDFRRACPNLYQILNNNIEEKSNKWWEFMNVRNLSKYRDSNIKILCPRTSNRNSFAIDTRKHIIKGTNSVIVSRNLNHYYCLGILNSKLADFWYQEYGFEYHGGEAKKYEPAKVKDYMIKIFRAPDTEQTSVLELVKELTLYTRVFKEFQKLWGTYLRDEGIAEKQLKTIIFSDKTAINEGQTNETWTVSVSIYPNANNPLLETVFDNFEILGKDDDILRIYGVRDTMQTLVLELKFHTNELRSIVFLDILRWFNSNLQFRTLREIYEKIKISVIKPNTWENSPSLINQTYHRFNTWLNNEGITLVITDIIEIYHHIQELDYEIDARIFRLYGFNNMQVNTILKTLKSNNYQISKILGYFNNF